jgi:hypothetical protein
MSDLVNEHGERIYDPNAKPEVAPEVIAPKRTPSIVLKEFFRALVKRLGNHPELETLLEEFEALTAAPEIPTPIPAEEEHQS